MDPEKGRVRIRTRLFYFSKSASIFINYIEVT
ncbi:hypothetical protein EDE05_101237 [Neorhizobium sp. R1-B]|nr:hypothetical protein EDE09_101372 [Neorhizobium sp. S3-V5DH]TDX88925.1 hypothetical protein EDE05_101237 [Neorhizobium sp. R1-B]